MALFGAPVEEKIAAVAMAPVVDPACKLGLAISAHAAIEVSLDDAGVKEALSDAGLPKDVHDLKAVLRALEEVPREVFVEEADRSEAYRDSALGIACGQTISQPFVVAYMTEQLQLQKHHRVLEIGTGSGYQAAILSRLCRDVLTIERYRTLADSARLRLEELGCDNVEVMLGDGFDIPANAGSFDRIMVTAAMVQIPDALLERLQGDGILIAPVGPQQGVQTLVRLVKTNSGFERRELVDVRFVPALPGIAREL